LLVETREAQMPVKRAKSADLRASRAVTSGSKGDPAYAPARTKLGSALRRIRRRIVEEGVPLLSRAQIRKEVADRQGGAE
jgi:hypothetical protein